MTDEEKDYGMIEDGSGFLSEFDEQEINSVEDVIEHVNKMAEENGYKVNEDSKVVDTVINGLFKRYEKDGELYCPCRLGTDVDNVCPCVHVDDEIAENGICHCRLYVKSD